MRFVFPISHSDKHLLPEYIKNLASLGGFRHHSITLAPAPSLFSEVQSYVPVLKEDCPRVECVATTREPEGHWVQSLNWMFQDVVIGLAQRKNTEAWMLMPLDHLPYKAGWQDAIETFYNASGLPYLGVIRNLADVSPTKEEGRFLHPCAVYPANLYETAQAEYHTLSPAHPFYVSMRWRTFGSGVKEYNIHQHIWWTKNGPVPEVAPVEMPRSVKEVPEVSLSVRLLNANYRQIIPGVWCAENISNNDLYMALGIPQISSEVQHGAQGDPEPGFAISPHETLDVAAEENPPEQGVDNAAPPVHTEAEDSGSQGETNETSSGIAPGGVDPQTGHISLLNDLTLRVARSKPTRIKDWAETLQVPSDELTSLINSHPEAGLSIARAGWVQLAAVQ